MFPLVFAALAMAPGCGIAQDRHGTHYPGIHEPPAARYQALVEYKERQRSRFADIEQATFFAKPNAPAAVPIAPPPAPPAEMDARPVVSELIPVPEPLAPPVAAIPATEADPGFLGITSCRPVSSQIRLTQQSVDGGLARDSEGLQSVVDDPRKLRKISEIQPYLSYEPDPIVRSMDPCKHLCPRPDGAPCEGEEADERLCPEEVVLSNELYVSRCFDDSVFAWEASNIHYNPLYFEDVPLERYGHTYPCLIQPFASAAKFSVQLVGLPYQMAIDPPCKKIYPLGYYRPGECAPKLHYQIPWNTRAAITQAAVTTGMFYLIP